MLNSGYLYSAYSQQISSQGIWDISFCWFLNIWKKKIFLVDINMKTTKEVGPYWSKCLCLCANLVLLLQTPLFLITTQRKTFNVAPSLFSKLLLLNCITLPLVACVGFCMWVRKRNRHMQSITKSTPVFSQLELISLSLTIPNCIYHN